MAEHLALIRLIEEPTRRRSWLLYKALECLPLDRAIDLARTADQFIVGVPSERGITDAPVRSEPGFASPPQANELELPAAAHAVEPEETMARKPTRLNLSAEQREQLLDRLALGAKNAELAAELGLSARQVHGIRMGSARDIAKRRERLIEKDAPAQDTLADAVSVDDIVRYLRQQDDVVVREGTGEFLVNARFRLPLTELVSRANRMRVRQGKPEFDLGAAGQPRRVETVGSANGHPIFWSEKTSGQSGSKPVSAV
jgi:hypothetical protein